ncbi:MAG TPA: SDR family NAD(P)-dependent oxidoreductase [Flavobacterium sp.]|nr:SDR family NAD(P)-dependent oxidoreductase [Flavobacterium sp.]
MKNISILGCGWLGFPLAKELANSGYPVKGSTTTEEKLAQLIANHILSYNIILEESGISGDVTAFLNGSNILIIDIPPRVNTGADFVSKIKLLIPYIEKSEVSNVLFVSSTSVYADDNRDVMEETVPTPSTESGRQLLAAEQLLQQNECFQTTIIRFGGLIGEDRHPITSLAGKTSIQNPDAPINLIHREDCIGIITSILDNDIWGEVINGVTPYHPARQDYYVAKAEEYGLKPPHFIDGLSVGKKVLSTKVGTLLKYKFKVPKL